MLPSGEKSPQQLTELGGTTSCALLPSAFAVKTPLFPLDGSIRSNVIWPLDRALAGEGGFPAAAARETARAASETVSNPETTSLRMGPLLSMCLTRFAAGTRSSG